MFVGIDVSKEWVDVAVHPTGETWHVGLDEEAVDGLVRKLRDLAPQVVVMEATGGYETELCVATGRRASPPQSSTRATSGTLRAPRAYWRRPIGSTLRS